jgi:hypothetical protein
MLAGAKAAQVRRFIAQSYTARCANRKSAQTPPDVHRQHSPHRLPNLLRFQRCPPSGWSRPRMILRPTFMNDKPARVGVKRGGGSSRLRRTAESALARLQPAVTSERGPGSATARGRAR